MATGYNPSEVTNPRKTLKRQEAEAESGPPAPDPKKGRDAGDLPAPDTNFFKPRDKSKDKAGLEKMLKNRK